MRRSGWPRYLVPSAALHAAVLGSLLSLPDPAKTPPPAMSTFLPIERVELEPPAQQPPPPAEPEPAAEPESKPTARKPPPLRQPAAARLRAQPAAPTPSQASAPAQPVRLGAIGLSNAQTAFALPMGPFAHTAPQGVPAQAASPRRSGPAAVALADLSQRPVAPELDALLRASYPDELQRRGIEGEAIMQIMVSEDGSIVRAATLSSTAPAFAEACRRALLRSRWSPPRDRKGRAVPTRLRYRCRFRISL